MRLSKTFLKIENIILIFFLVLGFFVRLYRFDNPVADWQSWRQSDTSAVSRNFVQSGFDLLHPKFDDLSNVPSGLDNPQGYRFVEFPIYNFFQAGFFELSGTLTLEEWGRLVTIFSSLLSSIFIFLIIKKRFGHLAGLLSFFFFLFIPYNIYYSRTILPDPSMVMAMLGAIYFFDKWLEKDKFSIFNFQFLISLIFMISALLLKPYAAFFTLPMIFLAWEKFGFKFLLKWQLWLFLIVSVLPLILWRFWMQQYPEGIPANAWLFNGGNIRFKGAFFYWIFADRIGRLILGYWGVAILILGLLAKYTKRNLLFILSFILSSLIYITVLARGNVQHDYYQILIIPTISILLGLGGNVLLSPLKENNRIMYYSIFLVCALFTLLFGWYFVRDYFNINNPSIVEAGKAVDKLTSKNAKIIANYNGDTAFLYQTKRKGWASFEKPLPQMIEMGASYLVLANPTKEDLDLGKTYKIISENPHYVIFDLKQKP